MDSSVGVFGKILSKEDFDKICRCCLSSGALGGIFELVYEETPLVNILYDLFSIQLDPEDDLPKKMCETCIGVVIFCCNFKKRYEASEAALCNIISIKIEDVNIERKPEPPEHNFEELGQTQLEKTITDFKEYETEKNVEQKVNATEQKPSRIFTCSCEKTFTSKLEFYQHRKLTKHDFLRDHQCKTCGKLFPKHGLRIHMKTHEAVKRYRCDHCEKQFASNTHLQIHMRIHTGERPYVCEFCPKSFTQMNTLQVHKRIHTGEKPYLCSFCGKRFAKKVYCDVHMRVHNEKKSESTSNFVCGKCGRPCKSKTAYKLHLYKHGLGTGQVNKDDRHQCKICKKFFASRSSLFFHTKSHNDEKQFLCNECGKTFRAKTVLDSHSLVHSGKKSFACDFCDKKFARQLNLRYHLHIHTGERPYACHLCPKTFTQAGSLSRHLQIHTGERPFVCKFCDKAFGRKSTLEAHVRTHTGEKPYKCEECTSMFCDSRSLRKHKDRKHQ